MRRLALFLLDLLLFSAVIVTLFGFLAKDINATDEPSILAGDLNCTPWSYKFYELMKNTSLKDSEKGFGYQPSWSTFHWMPLFCIDHLLSSREITAVKRYSGPYVGSDHLPVITVLNLQ